MKNRGYNHFIPHMRCPVSGCGLDYLVFGENSQTAWPDGVLISNAGHWYPVTKGVPRLLSGTLRGDYRAFWKRYEPELLSAGLKSKTIENDGSADASHRLSDDHQTQQSFGVKWNSQPHWGFEGGSAKVINKWIQSKYGWESPEAYQRMVKTRRRILDAGTGLGREVIRCARANPNAMIFGIDLSESVISAAKNCADFTQTAILQADLLAPPFAPDSFDLIIAEGVLHHTPNTRAALFSLVELMEPAGEIAFYVYRRKGPAREFCDDLLRDKITKLPPAEAFQQVQSLTRLGQTLSAVTQQIDVPDIPMLNIRAGRYSVQRLFYWNFLKCFWNDNLSFEENNLVNFDWYHPRYAHRHTIEDVHAWIEEANLQPIWIKEEEAGITVRAVKKD